jgi:hypothetical protein
MASAAAAILIRREKEIVAAMRSAGATSPATAVTMQAIGMHERLAFRKLRQHAVLREATGDRFYLDEPSWEALRAMRRRIAVVMICFVVVLGIVTFIGTILGTSGAH